MPTHLKRVLNQARLETESYEMMVQHLEKEMELNGLLAPNETNITGVHQIDALDPQQAPILPNRQDHATDVGNPAMLSKTAEK